MYQQKFRCQRCAPVSVCTLNLQSGSNNGGRLSTACAWSEGLINAANNTRRPERLQLNKCCAAYLTHTMCCSSTCAVWSAK